jgi:cytochrome c oxidase subunit 2
MNALPGRRRALGAAAGCALLAGLSAFVARSEEQVVRISARRFAYEPDKITLRGGMPAVLELTTADVAMGFNAPDLNARADIVPGEVTRLRFTPERAGNFPFYCDVFCGDGHERMSGTIRVVA